MRSVSSLPVVLLVTALLQPSVAPVAPKVSDAYHIVIPRKALAAGERIELKLEPPAPEGVRTSWSVTRTGSSVSGDAARVQGLGPPAYRAPYVIPAGTPPVKVTAALSGPGVKLSFTTEIELTPSSVPDAADCLGPGQSFSTVLAAIEPEYTPLDDLPSLVHHVEPEYPRSAFVRGVGDTIVVAALVCRSGRVLDAQYVPSFARPGDAQPIERDPKLIAAAVASVLQYVFSPATSGGQPVAVWVHNVVMFRP
jgi:hypothetical protein